MKNFKCCTIIAVVILMLLSGCSKNSNDTSEQNYVRITRNVFFENVFDDYQSIFFLNIDEKDFIEQNSYIIKYSFDGNNLIAFHANNLGNDISNVENTLYRTKGFGGSYYEIKRDYFAICNIDNSERISFNSQNEFVEYCKSNSLNLFDFKYSNGLGVMDYKKETASDRVEIIRFGNPFPDKLLIDDEVVFEGYISDYSVRENIVKFNIKIPDRAYLEFPSLSNPDIQQSESPVSEYKTGILVKEDIYYDGEVTYDMSLKKVVAFD